MAEAVRFLRCSPSVGSVLQHGLRVVLGAVHPLFYFTLGILPSVLIFIF